MSTPLLSHIADVAARTELDHMPDRAREQATIAILDVIGVTVAAANDDIGAGYLAHLREWGAAGPCAVVSESGTYSPIDAARTNATLAHALDFDDRGHASTHLFWSAFAAAEIAGASGAALLRAYVLAREARAALDAVVDDGRLDGSGPGSRGWHSTGVNGPITSAMAAALVLGLGADQVAHAMAMAASASAGLIANFGTTTKPLHAGRAAAEGITAALLIRRGLNADPWAVDGPAGLFEALGLDRDVASRQVSDRFGSTWDLVERGVRIKPYPSCTTTHPGIETALAIHRRLGPIEPTGIARLELDLRPFMLRRLDPRTGTDARFNMAHGVLTALLHGDVTLDDYDGGRVRTLAADIADAVQHAPGSKELVITLRDRTVIREPIAPLRNLTADEARTKFFACTAGWDGARQEAVIGAVSQLGQLSDVQSLGSLVGGAP
jgi:2-methylcitrate dehydratase PrpD